MFSARLPVAHHPFMETTKALAAAPAQSEHDAVFASCAKPTLFGIDRSDGLWYLCRIRSKDLNGSSYTIAWEDGTLQIGTQYDQLRRPAYELEALIEARVDKAVVRERETIGSAIYNGMTVWEAAKKGDLETTLTIIDRGGATPNDVEEFPPSTSKKKQRACTPLYWACFVGHVELVRELLVRGAIDSDGCAYQAVTGRDKNDIALIRAMLIVAQKTNTNFKRQINFDETRKLLPQKLYRSTATSECIICLSSIAYAVSLPCCHISSCTICLRKCKQNKNGCPICRAPIVDIVVLCGKPA